MMRAVPLLKCRDIERASRFYCEVLGAAVSWSWSGSPDGANPGYCSLVLDGAEIHLSSFAGDGAFGTTVYFYVTAVEPIAERVRALDPGALEHGPEDQPWGMRELYLRDPDNNGLRFGEPLAAVRPVP